ncbi:hypothetical protein [Terrimonas pollutisoli]|uniref:hypothetical protein n=1 Tax=Terrimonas pollutisoli TaxID=3034147 RepID=UPI0023EBCEB6|nr:hypothetical protein [Terrimonas sp. H1YJ31]
MKKYFTLCLLLLTGMIAVAQQGINLQVLTPPPPDVSALGKFGLVPVDNFTGVPSISIPVYTIKDGTLEFPVSLQYHAGGIKVKEEASEVGLGWALSAAGSIVSIIRGHPDFAGAPYAPGFSHSYIYMPDPPAVQLNTKSPYYSLNDWYYQWKNDLQDVGYYENDTRVKSGLTLIKNGAINQYINHFTFGYDGQAPDFASDLYIITIGNKSYKFIFDNNFKPVVLGDGSLKIELIDYDWNYPNWKVTDESGTAYYFEQRQFYYSNNSYPANSGTAKELNTWHLTRIVSPTYGEITFTYLHSNLDFISPVPNISQTYLVGNTSPHTQQYTNMIKAHYTMYQQLNIESIQFSLGNMKFFYDPVRLDLMGARRLQAIEVRDKNDRLVKKMILDNNHYFTASSGMGGEYPSSLLPGEFTLDKTTKRLRLNAVSEVDVADPAKEKKYTFTYNNGLNLPSKLSYSIDHWGYYNGAINSELVPPATLSVSTNPAMEFSGANRNADPAYMQANTLTAVQYPTGGTTNFTYETNQFKRTETVITYQDESSQLYKETGSATVNTSGFVDANGNFTVASDWAGKKLKIVSIVARNSSYPPDPYTLDIIVKKNGIFLKRIPVSTVIGTSMDTDESIILETGNYNISYDAATSDFFNSCEIRRSVYVLKASMTSEQVLKTVYSGGLRISKIRNIDPLSGNVNTKTYTYSNGTEDDLPVYESAEGYDTWVDYVEGQIDLNWNYFRYRYGQSIYPFSDGRNAPYFGYEKVEVRDVDNNNNANGLSEYNYSTTGSININTMARFNTVFDHSRIINPIMTPIPDIPMGSRGKLNLEKHYKLVNGTTLPVSSTTYYYTRDNSTTVWQMLFNQGLSEILAASAWNLEQEFKIDAHHFSIPVLRNMLRRKEYSEYDASGNVSISQFEDYTYDNVNGHYQLIKKSTQNSKGETLNTYYKYPQDFGDLTSVSNLDQESQGLRLLQQTHVVAPIEIYNERVNTSNAKKYLGGQINIFNTDLPTIKQILALETAAPLTTFSPSAVNNGAFNKNSLYTSRIRFTKYDANGRLVEQQKENDVKHTYLWGYNGAYPVAEVIGVDYANVIATPGLNLTVIQSSATTDANMRAELNKIRATYPSALVITYTYQPLVGMTSQTDANNRITYYEYDGFGRLKLIKDMYGNIIKTMDYKYKTN